MFIELDSDIIGQGNPFTGREIDALSNLARSAREGSHVLVAPPVACSALSKLEQLSQRESEYFRLIEARYSTLYTVKPQLDVTVCVIRYGTITFESIEGRKVIKVPLEHFYNSDTSRKTRLLCENIMDCEVLEVLFKAYAQLQGEFNIPIAFEHVHGGGNTTAALLKRDIERNDRFVLTVVDSDKEHSEGKLGGTAKAVAKSFHASRNGLVELITLASREMENLLPDSFYLDHVAEQYPDTKPAMLTISSLKSLGHSDARSYLDIKNGLRLDKLLKLSKSGSPSCVKTWKPIQEKLGGAEFPHSNIDPNCLSRECCKNDSLGQKCECLVIGRGRDDALRIAIDVFPTYGKGLLKDIPQSIEGDLTRLMKAMLSWGCATSQQSS